MGFKRIDLKEMETSLLPAFLGLPVKHIEDIEKLQKQEKGEKAVTLKKESKVYVINEEVLEYHLNKEKNLEKFIGTGVITVVNNSKKDRIWDVCLELSGSQNINLNENETIILSSFEPETNKKINYNILDSKKLPPPIQINENIELININLEKNDLTDFKDSLTRDKLTGEISAKEDERQKIESLERTETSDKEAFQKEMEQLVRKETDNLFNPRIEMLKADISTQEKYLEELNDTKNQYDSTKKELTQTNKILKRQNNKSEKSKKKELKKRLSEISEEDKTEKTPEFKNALGDLNSKINSKETEFENINKEIKFQEESINKEIKQKFDNKIKDLQSDLEKNRKKLEETTKSYEGYVRKEDETADSIKDLEKNYNQIIKEKSNELKDRLKETLDEEKKQRVEEEINEKFKNSVNKIESDLNNKKKVLTELSEKVTALELEMKELKKLVNNLESENNSLQKTKENTLEKGLKEINKEQKNKIKKITAEINALKSEIPSLEEKYSKIIVSVQSEVNNKYDSDIEKNEIELNKSLENLEKHKQKKDVLKTEENSIKDKINNLRKQLKKLLNEKEKAFKERLKEKVKDNIKVDKEEQNQLKKQKTSKYKFSFKDISLKKREKLTRTTFKDDLEIENNEDVSDSHSINLQTIPPEQEVKEISQTQFQDEPVKINNNYYLLLNKLNKIKFNIELSNYSNNVIQDITMAKYLSDEFINIKYESEVNLSAELRKSTIVFSIKELNPKEKITIIVYAEIKPINKSIIGTGSIQLSYLYKNFSISGTKIKSLTGYSHAMHAIKIKEKETEPNLWDCSLIFTNNSDLDMELMSVLVSNKEKNIKYLDETYNHEKHGKLIKPDEKYISKNWTINDINEPKFYRKLKYSISSKSENVSKINVSLEEEIFNLIELNISKTFSEKEIKSFEESKIECYINIKNTGTTPVLGLLLTDVVPADYLPSNNISDFNIHRSSGKKQFKNLKLKINPENNDHSMPHTIELGLNLGNEIKEPLLEIDEFLEIRYLFKAITPNYNKKYGFPLSINSYYPKEKEDHVNNYKVEHTLNKEQLPNIKIIHKRRDLLIGKEIFPGRTVDEFAISILIKNNSNVELSNIKIDDTITNSFELISSNVEYEVKELQNNQGQLISFLVDRILPLQEREVRYYVKNKSGKKISYDELESYIFS